MSLSEREKAEIITTINYDCLERIFDFLDIKSLLMLAGTSKRLQAAATEQFGHAFSLYYTRSCKFTNQTKELEMAMVLS